MKVPRLSESRKMSEGVGLSRSEGHRESTKYLYLPAVMSQHPQIGDASPTPSDSSDIPTITAWHDLAEQLDRLATLLDEIGLT